MDIKKILCSKKFTLPTTVFATFLLALSICNRDTQEEFADKQDSVVYTTDNTTGKQVVNRDYFNPSAFITADWTNMSNKEIGKLFGLTAAKEMGLDIDSINRNLATPGKIYGLDYNYCTKSVTNALVDATRRMKFRDNCYAGRLFAKQAGRNEALYNGDHLVNYFAKDSVPGTVINNPEQNDFKQVTPGAIIRFPGHTKMFMGIGFVDNSGTVFVPDSCGRPVIASGYNERFSYFLGDDCVVIDVAKIVEHNLTKAGRQR